MERTVAAAEKVSTVYANHHVTDRSLASSSSDGGGSAVRWARNDESGRWFGRKTLWFRPSEVQIRTAIDVST